MIASAAQCRRAVTLGTYVILLRRFFWTLVMTSRFKFHQLSESSYFTCLLTRSLANALGSTLPHTSPMDINHGYDSYSRKIYLVFYEYSISVL